MGILKKVKNRLFINRQDSIIFEITPRCNLSCSYCYNVWKNHPDYPTGELDTAGVKKLLSKIIRESHCRLVTLTGGEPMLRDDIIDIVRHLKDEGVEINVISNGTLFTEDSVRELVQSGVTLFELPLLSYNREVHNRLVGADAFDRVVESIADIKLAGGLVVAVFVATNENIEDLEKTIELDFVLGVNGIMFNRFNPGGEGSRHIHRLLPSPEKLVHALEIADRCIEKYGIGISSSIAIQPCIVDISRFKNLTFGFCAAGTKRSYYTLDALGNLRMCNHTPSILGNLFDATFTDLTTSKKVKQFMAARPPFCSGCAMELECQGGCKAASESSYGDIRVEEPFLKENIDMANKRKVTANEKNE